MPAVVDSIGKRVEPSATHTGTTPPPRNSRCDMGRSRTVRVARLGLPPTFNIQARHPATAVWTLRERKPQGRHW